MKRLSPKTDKINKTIDKILAKPVKTAPVPEKVVSEEEVFESEGKFLPKIPQNLNHLVFPRKTNLGAKSILVPIPKLGLRLHWRKWEESERLKRPLFCQKKNFFYLQNLTKSVFLENVQFIHRFRAR